MAASLAVNTTTGGSPSLLSPTTTTTDDSSSFRSGSDGGNSTTTRRTDVVAPSMLTPATSTYNPGHDDEAKGASSPTGIKTITEEMAKLSSSSSPQNKPFLPPVITHGQNPNTPFLTPPGPIVHPYDAEKALEGDLNGCVHALSLFLSSQMHESEAYLKSQDPAMQRLYFGTGFGLIQCVKGLMSYEDKDLLAGIAATKHGNTVASAHRKKSGGWVGSRIAGYVAHSVSNVLGGSAEVQWIRGMTDTERHAELTFAESLFEKALLGIVYSGDWLAFIKEALNMRTTIGVYRNLYAYIEAQDAAYAATHVNRTKDVNQTAAPDSPFPDQVPSLRPNEDPAIDGHFRSGVYLGVGLSHIILSMLPGKLSTLVELFGYKGDRKTGLELLMRAGGWNDTPGAADDYTAPPRIPAHAEGVRRAICDMALLIFHLVLSSFTFEGVDVRLAGRILRWNLERYPEGVFFLFGAGRLSLIHSRPQTAIAYYQRAMEVQTQYRNLHHISFWEIAISRLALWDVRGSLECWRDLEREATWSKAIYTYGMAVCLLESGDDDQEASSGAKETQTDRKKRLSEAMTLMGRVPGLRQKIAGKSIPLEKFVARKARKFTSQGGRLALPALELAYLFQGIAHAPRTVIIKKMLPEVEAAMRKLGVYEETLAAETVGSKGKTSGKTATTTDKEWKAREKAYYKAVGGNGTGYWDDYALVMFLRGVCLRYVAYPDPDAELDPEEDMSAVPAQSTAAKAAEYAFQAVFTHGPQIELDHHLVYHAHYELGRLLSNLPETVFPSHASFTSETSHKKNHRGEEQKAHGPAEAAALEQFELILSGKHLEVGPSGKKGKYSMENALAMRTHAAVDVLGHGGRL
ncbi:hypothetical protein D9619_009454 [Psilocybe cf. subviscida]|uniref:Tetratricopeptide repeat protein 39B n=1 Tax=Psilocybe cf. subviscida TaxID=2480587 RepID=A0A8H5FAL6_9AGAR|nr:hypothetical protein D9619_009454 [Psilocybe cf. subviscida]